MRQLSKCDCRGRVFAGRYTIHNTLGSGGFGTVYRASDTKLRIDVALEVTKGALADENALQRFEREARVIVRLNHENIVKRYDFQALRNAWQKEY